MTIECDTTDDLTAIVAGLVREGLTFECRKARGLWIVTLTGGY